MKKRCFSSAGGARADEPLVIEAKFFSEVKTGTHKQRLFR